MHAKLDWQGEIAFTAVADSSLKNDYSINIDGPAAIGGQGSGVRPMEMVLFGLGGCAGVDFISILKKQRLLPKSCTITLDAQRSNNTPKIFTNIQVTFNLQYVPNINLNPSETSKINRAAELSVTKYCSVYAMLEKTVEISFSIKYTDN
jgi:putative redox protein